MNWRWSDNPCNRVTRKEARRILLQVRVVVAVSILCFCLEAASGQSARPLVGTLIVSAPRGLMSSQDYWVYINGRIVSSPHVPFDSCVRVAAGVGANGSPAKRYKYFVGDVGLVAESEGGNVTFVRSGYRSLVFESDKHLLNPGEYMVELLSRGVALTGAAREQPAFPFTYERKKVKVVAGKIVEVEFEIPAGEPGSATPVTIAAAAPVSPDKLITEMQSSFDSTVKRYRADPVATALNRVLQSLSQTPPTKPRVYVNLPVSCGGGRDMDIQQVNLIIDRLNAGYKFVPIEANSPLYTAPAPTPELAKALSLQIDNHNKLIDSLRQITRALEQATGK